MQNEVGGDGHPPRSRAWPLTHRLASAVRRSCDVRSRVKDDEEVPVTASSFQNDRSSGVDGIGYDIWGPEYGTQSSRARPSVADSLGRFSHRLRGASVEVGTAAGGTFANRHRQGQAVAMLPPPQVPAIAMNLSVGAGWFGSLHSP